MSQFAVIGIGHHQTPIDVRERLNFSAAQASAFLTQLRTAIPTRGRARGRSRGSVWLYRLEGLIVNDVTVTGVFGGPSLGLSVEGTTPPAATVSTMSRPRTTVPTTA